MRKIAAIFFLSILCFNCVGYKYIFNFLERKNDRRLEAKLDQQDYDESSLISLKAAFSIPYSYLSKSDKFERWSGEIELNGVRYKYVKRRFFNDSIELLCIPNIASTKLKEAKHDFFRLSNDVQSEQQGKNQDSGKIPAFKNLLSEYYEEVPDLPAGSIKAKLSHHSSYIVFVPQFTGDSPGQPPDLS